MNPLLITAAVRLSWMAAIWFCLFHPATGPRSTSTIDTVRPGQPMTWVSIHKSTTGQTSMYLHDTGIILNRISMYDSTLPYGGGFYQFDNRRGCDTCWSIETENPIHDTLHLLRALLNSIRRQFQDEVERAKQPQRFYSANGLFFKFDQEWMYYMAPGNSTTHEKWKKIVAVAGQNAKGEREWLIGYDMDKPKKGGHKP